MDSNKKFSFRLNTDGPKTYEAFLFRMEEDGLQIHFANTHEEDDSTVVSVENIIQVPKEKMVRFCYDFYTALIDYEAKFKNGYGIDISSPKKKGKAKKNG